MGYHARQTDALGLRVIGVDRSAPGLRRGMLRALVYGGLSQGPEQIPILVLGFEGVGTLAEASPRFGVVLGLLSIVGPVALFSTMRARNGFATLHGLASRTRVVAVASDTARTTFARWRASGWRLRVARDDRRYVGARP